MCKFCELDNDGEIYCSHLAGDNHKRGSPKGFSLVMRTSKGLRIANSKFEYHDTLDNRIAYIQAIEWDKAAFRHQNIAVEIQYCPFCGRKL